MKRIIIIVALLASIMTVSAISQTTKRPISQTTKIEPANWFIGMKDPTVQLMVYGENIGGATVTTDYPGVIVDSVVTLDSPNYLFVYLNIERAKAGEMKLIFQKNGKKQQVKFPLMNREKSGEERIGFSNEDVLYMLMPDRFAQGQNHPAHIKGMNTYVEDRSQPSLRHGGDLEGIRQHLDYFNELGVTALWFTPVLENNSPDNELGYSTYHGYATTDYYRVDPRFGTNEDYRRLVDEAHAKGLKVVMDMIFNHSGFEHPWVKDMPSNDWFNLHDWLKESKGTSDPRGTSFLQTSYKLTPVMDPYASKVDMRETTEGWFVPTMPDLNQKNPHLMRYLIQNSEWWIETIGIDGIRMDTYPYADRTGMAQWMKVIDNEYPNFNTVGETWVTEPGYTAAWQDGFTVNSLQFTDDYSDGSNGLACKSTVNHQPSTVNKRSYLKTVMDFSFFDKLSMAKHEETDDWWKGFNRIYNSLVYDYLYPNPSSVMAFIENHDTDRFLGNGKDSTMLKQALALLLTLNRTPQLYYGTEILMNGTKEVTDGNVRKDFPGGFPGDERNAFTAEGRTKAENAMFQWLSKLLHWRQGNDVITKGRQTQFIPWHGVYVIARQYHGKNVLTILNGKRSENKLEVDRYAEIIGNTKTARDVITGETYDLTKNIILPQRAALVLEF